jgi:hypothetical protein
MTIKLTDTPRLLLSAAASRDDRCLVMPNTLKGGAARKVIAKLLEAGLARQIAAKTGLPVWRRDKETGHAYALKATVAGLKAVATGNEVDVARAAKPPLSRQKPVAKTPEAVTDSGRTEVSSHSSRMRRHA